MDRENRFNSRVSKYEQLESRNPKTMGLYIDQLTETPEILSSEAFPNRNASTLPSHTFSSSLAPYFPESYWLNTAVFPPEKPNLPSVIPPYQELHPHYSQVASPFHEQPPHYSAVPSPYHELPSNFMDSPAHEFPPQYSNVPSPYHELSSHNTAVDATYHELNPYYPAGTLNYEPFSHNPDVTSRSKVVHQSKGSKAVQQSKESKVVQQSKGSNFVNPSKVSLVPQSTMSTSDLATEVPDSAVQSKAFSSVYDSKVPQSVPQSKESNFLNPPKLSSMPQSVTSTSSSNLLTKLSDSQSDHSLARLYLYELQLNVKKPSKQSSKENEAPSSNAMSPQSKVPSRVPPSKVSNKLPPSKKSSSESLSKNYQPVPKSKVSDSASKSKEGLNSVSPSEKFPTEPFSERSKPKPPSKLSNSGHRSEASSNSPQVTDPSISSNNPPSKDLNSVLPSNESPFEVDYWKCIPDPKDSSSKPRQKWPSTVSGPKKQTPPVKRPVVCTFKRPHYNSTKNFAELAEAVYYDILKFPKEMDMVRSPDEDIKNPIRKTIRDLFVSKIEFFKTCSNDIDPSSTTNFYKMFFCWGLRLMSDDLTEEKIYEFIIKVCCCAISIESRFPNWGTLVRENAIEAIAECCVLCTSKCTVFWQKIGGKEN